MESTTHTHTQDMGVLMHGSSHTKYCIAGNFCEKYDLCGENFHRLLTFAVPKDTTPQILQRKLLRIATKPQNS